MQHAIERVERPGESQEALDGKKGAGERAKFEKLWRIRFQSNHFGWIIAVNLCYFASKKWINQGAKVQLSEVWISNYTGSVSYLKTLHLCTLQNWKCTGVSFPNLSVSLGAAPRHVQRVRFLAPEITTSWSVNTSEYRCVYIQLFQTSLDNIDISFFGDRTLFRAKRCPNNLKIGFYLTLGPKKPRKITHAFLARALWMTGRSKSRPNDHRLDSWAGTSACDRPGIPSSPETKVKVQMLQRIII